MEILIKGRCDTLRDRFRKFEDLQRHFLWVYLGFSPLLFANFYFILLCICFYVLFFSFWVSTAVLYLSTAFQTPFFGDNLVYCIIYIEWSQGNRQILYFPFHLRMLLQFSFYLLIRFILFFFNLCTLMFTQDSDRRFTNYDWLLICFWLSMSTWVLRG